MVLKTLSAKRLQPASLNTAVLMPFSQTEISRPEGQEEWKTLCIDNITLYPLNEYLLN